MLRSLYVWLLCLHRPASSGDSAMRCWPFSTRLPVIVRPCSPTPPHRCSASGPSVRTPRNPNPARRHSACSTTIARPPPCCSTVPRSQCSFCLRCCSRNLRRRNRQQHQRSSRPRRESRRTARARGSSSGYRPLAVQHPPRPVGPLQIVVRLRSIRHPARRRIILQPLARTVRHQS